MEFSEFRLLFAVIIICFIWYRCDSNSFIECLLATIVTLIILAILTFIIVMLANIFPELLFVLVLILGCLGFGNLVGCKK